MIPPEPTAAILIPIHAAVSFTAAAILLPTTQPASAILADLLAAILSSTEQRRPRRAARWPSWPPPVSAILNPNPAQHQPRRGGHLVGYPHNPRRPSWPPLISTNHLQNPPKNTLNPPKFPQKLTVTSPEPSQPPEGGDFLGTKHGHLAHEGGGRGQARALLHRLIDLSYKKYLCTFIILRLGASGRGRGGGLDPS